MGTLFESSSRRQRFSFAPQPRHSNSGSARLLSSQPAPARRRCLGPVVAAPERPSRSRVQAYISSMLSLLACSSTALTLPQGTAAPSPLPSPLAHADRLPRPPRRRVLHLALLLGQATPSRRGAPPSPAPSPPPLLPPRRRWPPIRSGSPTRGSRASRATCQNPCRRAARWTSRARRAPLSRCPTRTPAPATRTTSRPSEPPDTAPLARAPLRPPPLPSTARVLGSRARALGAQWVESASPFAHCPQRAPLLHFWVCMMGRRCVML